MSSPKQNFDNTLTVEMDPFQKLRGTLPAHLEKERNNLLQALTAKQSVGGEAAFAQLR